MVKISVEELANNRKGWKNMNEKIKEQILAIRDSGVTNMFDVNRVQYEAYHSGFYELVTYLEDHKKEYAQFIMTGKTEKP